MMDPEAQDEYWWGKRPKAKPETEEVLPFKEPKQQPVNEGSLVGLDEDYWWGTPKAQPTAKVPPPKETKNGGNGADKTTPNPKGES